MIKFAKKRLLFTGLLKSKFSLVSFITFNDSNLLRLSDEFLLFVVKVLPAWLINVKTVTPIVSK